MMRLDKYLAERTGMTRSESRKAITKGRVMVAGKICRKADTQLDETAAQINIKSMCISCSISRRASSAPAATSETLLW